jgi:hypothetical protein
MRRILIFLTVASLVSLGSVASATTILSYQDTTKAPGDTITYTLTFDGPPSGSATLTISNSADVSPSGGEIYVGAIVMQMDGGTPVDITPTPTSPLPTSWKVSDVSENSSVKIVGGGRHLNQSVRQGGFAGFYSQTVADLGTNFDGLLCVTCAPTTYTFRFTYTGASKTSDIPFQAIYYDGTSFPGFDGILSKTLGSGPVPPSQEVPELGTLLLLGSGVAALGSAGLARRRRLGSQ